MYFKNIFMPAWTNRVKTIRLSKIYDRENNKPYCDFEYL